MVNLCMNFLFYFQRPPFTKWTLEIRSRQICWWTSGNFSTDGKLETTITPSSRCSNKWSRLDMFIFWQRKWSKMIYLSHNSFIILIKSFWCTVFICQKYHTIGGYTLIEIIKLGEKLEEKIVVIVKKPPFFFFQLKI